MEYLDSLGKSFGGKQEVVTESVHTVDSVRADGSVNLKVGTNDGDIVDAIPALSSYVSRQAGDKVTVRKARGSWVVLGKAGAMHEPSSVSVSTGADPPSGAGWVQAKTVWARGSEVYIQRDTAAQPDPPEPSSVTIGPSGEAAYAEGYLNVGKSPRQGTWSGYGPWRGIWTYGSAIADACAGRTVSGMTVHLMRSGERHGAWSKQYPSIWTHGYSSPPSGSPSLANRHDPGHGLGLGGAFDYPLTSAQVAALEDGTQLGVGVYTAEIKSDYIIYESSGAITISFSD